MKVTKGDVSYAILLTIVGIIAVYPIQMLISVFFLGYPINIFDILITIGIIIVIIIIFKYEKGLLKK